MSPEEALKLATRKSPLALWQAEEVQRRLAATNVSSTLVKMTTQGDQRLDTALSKIAVSYTHLTLPTKA